MIRSLCCLLLFACGSAAHGSQPPARPFSPVTAELPPNERECDALIAHAIDLGLAEQRAAAPDRAATDADGQQIETELRAKLGPACRELARPRYRCAIAAASLDELERCDQDTRSSSTSNNSVAPGGINPPAPRSP